MPWEAPPRICDDGTGKIFPVGGLREANWPQVLKIFLYGLGLSWCFMGVAIIADIFMAAIETITAQKKRIKTKEGKSRTVKVWNPTVANLTLMALGSSAPEILLNLIEVFGDGMHSGSLGAGTIVGSAAVNLFVIIAVCIMSIPDNETRRIKDVQVFAVTATFSVFAYLWLLIVLVGHTPKKVDVWEGLATFMLFPMLVVVAYCADIGVFGEKASLSAGGVSAAEMSKEEQAELIAQIQRDYPGLSQEELQEQIMARTAVRPTRATYRVHNMKGSAGYGRNVTFSKMATPGEVGTNYRTKQNAEGAAPAGSSMDSSVGQTLVMGFASDKYSVMENMGKLVVTVDRRGGFCSGGRVSYRTAEGSAKQGKRFVHTEGTIHFRDDQTLMTFEIPIIDDDEFQEDETFMVELHDAERYDGGPVVVEQPVATVTIENDDDAPSIGFKDSMIQVAESSDDFEITVPIERKGGSALQMSCTYRTEADTAIASEDYVHKEGTLNLQTGAKACGITLTIKRKGRYESSERFRLILENPDNCTFDTSRDDTTEEQAICTIEIVSDPQNKGMVDAVSKAIGINWDKNKIGTSDWKEQFRSALLIGGDIQSQQEASTIDWISHVIVLPWKFLFALVPPTSFYHGWLTFGVSLGFIGTVTAIIGDLAMLFGCSLDMKDEITAITFVAVGTSLPDTFASRTAAQQDEYADGSIGNVTGSNSVNVFLGLGLPWAAGSIYWSFNSPNEEWLGRYPSEYENYPGGGFIVKADGLGFSVGMYSLFAMMAISLLLWRRWYLGGELGGPKRWKWVSVATLIIFEVVYVVASWVYVEVVG